MVAADDDVWDVNNYGLLGFDIQGDGVRSDSGREIDLEDNTSGANAGQGKENHFSTNSERSRTYWTPPMERYPIDLLMDQLHRGNKIGQTFVSQAWIDMVTSFNAKFGSCHDKDVLKNRYKHMKRQDNDIKVHSSPQLYRKLLVDNPMLTYGSCRHTLMPDHTEFELFHAITNCALYMDEKVLVEDIAPASDRRDEQSAAPIDPGKFEWTQPMDRCFTVLMLEQVHGVFLPLERVLGHPKPPQSHGFEWNETQHTISAETISGRLIPRNTQMLSHVEGKALVALV
ncbi:Myb/SANT-like domain [Dillenia turbinata]|uniref:Myb/SANT-like domain n=1 Tax=Dillenia turbinata TaxID=194707 RepID=A0AAN8VE76_9MAGN